MKEINPVEEKILAATEKRMIAFGYRKVTMDEIAQDLGMSKNTIYKYFSSKDHIAKVLLERMKKRINQKQLIIEKDNEGPLDVIYKNVFYLQHELAPWFVNFLPDIKHDLPEQWETFVHYRTEKILEIEKLVEAGIKKGIFRNVNPTIAVRSFLGAVDATINPDILQHENISFEQALQEILRIWSSGLLVKKLK